MRALPELERRRRAVEKVKARFDGKSFLLGRRDCIRLAGAMLTALGHKVPKIPPYKNELGALRRLKEQGASNVTELLDGLGLPRIAPAAALMGDLIFMPGDGDKAIGSVTVSLGNGAVLGFHDTQPGLVAMRPMTLSVAWSAKR